MFPCEKRLIVSAFVTMVTLCVNSSCRRGRSHPNNFRKSVNESPDTESTGDLTGKVNSIGYFTPNASDSGVIRSIEGKEDGDGDHQSDSIQKIPPQSSVVCVPVGEVSRSPGERYLEVVGRRFNDRSAKICGAHSGNFYV